MCCVCVAGALAIVLARGRRACTAAAAELRLERGFRVLKLTAAFVGLAYAVGRLGVRGGV